MAKLAHAQWSSKMGFVLAAAGSAVGLGNIWRFSYLTGESGGAAFVLVYLACVALVGLPILIAEWMIGRRGQKNPINTMAELAKRHGRSSGWAAVGVSGVLAAFLILSFYSVIGGWSLNYTLGSITGAFSGQDAEASEAAFGALLGNPGSLLIWHTLFMVLVVGIVARGVTKGLEAAARVLMPALVVLLLVLVGYGAMSGSFGEAFAFMFRPDWSALNGSVMLAAMGQAFFTLSLGMGIMMAYGSYLGEDVNLLGTARTVIILDTAIALLAGLAIFPIVFATELDASSGPGLIFITLPIAFGNIFGGSLLGLGFFLLLTFAALTSAISLLEPVVETLEERTALGRLGATVTSAVAVWLVGVAALLSLNVWSDVLLFGLNIFDLLDTFTGKILLPLTGLGAILFYSYCLNQEEARRELGLGTSAFGVWSVLTKFVAPIGVVAVFVAGFL
ncbi:sodium-dependent transporter [Halomonas sp. HNIBRBA4712]|uniref:sodium-dependent transporter n=1 Tax=Halomonas sp. HNIBRBA4712 TaxID=3373087 RepID=UPI0037465CB3